MATGKQGSAQVTVSLTDSGGTPRAITAFVMELGEATIEVNTTDSTAFAAAWRATVPVGMRSVPVIPIGGDFDTTATTGPHVVMRPGDSDALPTSTARVLVLVFGDSKTFTVSGWLKKYGVKAQVGELTKFACDFEPTGAGVWS